MENFDPLIDAMRVAETVVFFTGAGVSTLCGIPDFRGPDGIYRDPDAARMFDITLFREDPSFFYNHADRLVYGNSGTKPGPVHKALAQLQYEGKCAGVITQNIDGLHERAGSNPVFAVHGSAALHHCLACGAEYTFDEVVKLRNGVSGSVPYCLKCGGVIKPDITFFGEMLPEAAFDNAMRLASKADLMIVLGSSLTVHPACSIPRCALMGKGRLAIINNGETPYDDLAFFRAADLSAFATAVSSAFHTS